MLLLHSKSSCQHDTPISPQCLLSSKFKADHHSSHYTVLQLHLPLQDSFISLESCTNHGVAMLGSQQRSSRRQYGSKWTHHFSARRKGHEGGRLSTTTSSSHCQTCSSLSSDLYRLIAHTTRLHNHIRTHLSPSVTALPYPPLTCTQLLQSLFCHTSNREQEY